MNFKKVEKAMERQDQLVQTMKEKAEAVQTVVKEIDSLEEAFLYAVDMTRRQGGKTLAAPGLAGRDDAALSSLENLCKENGLTLLQRDLRSHLTGIHTGFTIADYGIAETATLVQNSSSEDVRIATMLSEIHVAVLPRSLIRPDAISMEDELSRLMKASPSYVAFISGASRTADIERVLTIGVHGPQELHLLIMSEGQEARG